MGTETLAVQALVLGLLPGVLVAAAMAEVEEVEEEGQA